MNITESDLYEQIGRLYIANAILGRDNAQLREQIELERLSSQLETKAPAEGPSSLEEVDG